MSKTSCLSAVSERDGGAQANGARTTSGVWGEAPKNFLENRNCSKQPGCHSAGMFMFAWTPGMMKMGFVVAPSGTDPEGSTTKAIFVVIFFASSFCLIAKKMFPT
jgi:hypothetical protein